MQYVMRLSGLLGYTVKALAVNADVSTLRLDVREPWPFHLDTDGDCCSETWFSDVLNVAALLGGTIQGVTERVGKDLGHPSRQEVDLLYGIDLTTEKGTCQIEFRNSSNGYYGGSASLYAGYPGKEDIQRMNQAWREITEDWSA